MDRLRRDNDRLRSALAEIEHEAADRLDVLKQIGTRPSDWLAMADIRDTASAALAGGSEGGA